MYFNIIIGSKSTPNIDIPKKGNEYLIKFENKSYRKTSWVNESFFQKDKDTLNLFYTFYVYYFNI